MDREADCFEIFDAQRRNARVDVLVRAKHDRRLDQGGAKLFATLRNAPAAGHVEIEVARQTKRPKASRKQPRPARSARVARAEVHYRTLTLGLPRFSGRLRAFASCMGVGEGRWKENLTADGS